MISRMDIEPCGFIYNTEVFIFEDDIFGSKFGVESFRFLVFSFLKIFYFFDRIIETYDISFFEFYALFRFFAIEFDFPSSYRFKNSGKWSTREIFSEKFIESLVRITSFYFDFSVCHYWRMVKSRAVLVVICGIWMVRVRRNPLEYPLVLRLIN